MEERLQKLMAQAGIASRRESEVYLTAGRVTVNGKVAHLGDKAESQKDDIRVDGVALRIMVTRTYVMIYKPMGIVTAVVQQSQEHRRVVRSLIPLEGHLYPVGRLDADSEGLVMMTDDGDLAQRLTHPRYEHPKTYEVDLRGNLSDDQIEKWRRGIVLDDGPTLPAQVTVTSRNNDVTHLTIVMREGRKRQIRRIASLLGTPVSRLVRTHIGPLALGNLRPGEWRYLSDSELEMLQKQAKSPARRARRRIVAPANPNRPKVAPGSTFPQKRRPDRTRPAHGSHAPRTFRPTRRPADSPTGERGNDDRSDRNDNRGGGDRNTAERGSERAYDRSTRRGTANRSTGDRNTGSSTRSTDRSTDQRPARRTSRPPSATNSRPPKSNNERRSQNSARRSGAKSRAGAKSRDRR